LNLEMKGRAQLYKQAQQQGRPPSLARTATTTTLASGTVADISASQEQGLKDIQMRLYEEINTWLTADDIALASTNGNGHTNPPSSTSSSETYHAFMTPGGGDYGGGGGKDSQDAPYGALCEILGLDRKQWDL